MTPSQEVHPGLLVSPLERLDTSLLSLPSYRSEVLVVGTGVAGMCAALSAAEQGANVIVLSKGGIDETNTRYAQGGLAAAIGEDDTIQAHAGDTLSVGCDLSEVGVVDAIVGGGPDAVAWLMKLGFAVDRDEQGKVSLRREGGHRIARILHSGGTATGRELQRALGAQIRNNP